MVYKVKYDDLQGALIETYKNLSGMAAAIIFSLIGVLILCPGKIKCDKENILEKEIEHSRLSLNIQD